MFSSKAEMTEKAKNKLPDWISVTVRLPEPLLETVSGFLFQLGAEGLSQQADSVTVYFAAARWTPETYSLLKEYLKNTLPDFDEQQLTVTALEEQDWNRAWKAYFKPERVTRRLVVCPPWEKYRPAKNERVLIINPKMAFGTGHHETTKLLLMFLEEFDPRGKTVLDIGAGSGILSIYAVMLGASGALGVDVESAAVENARENAELNGVSQQTDFLVGELNRVPARRYPLILANINRRVLEDLAAPLKEYIEPQGTLLLSGLLVKDLPVIERHYQQQGWRVVSRKRLGEWQALALTGRE